MSPGAGAEGFADADLAGALGDADEHDVHDDDAADDERDEGDGAGDGAEGLGDGGEEADEGVVGVELKGVGGTGGVVAAGTDQDADLVGGGIEHGTGGARLDVDDERLRGAVALLVGGEGDGDPVILAGAKGASLLFADADDAVGRAVDAQLLAERVHADEEVIDDVGADDGDVRGVLFVAFGEAAALNDVEVLECRHLPGVAADTGVGDGLGSANDLAGGGLLGADADAALAVFRDVVVVGEEDVFAFLEALVVFGAGDELRHLGDGEDVGAVAGELGGDVGIGAVDEGDDGDDAGDADDDAQQGKHGAQLVRPERLQRNPECLFELHFASVHKAYQRPWQRDMLVRAQISVQVKATQASGAKFRVKWRGVALLRGSLPFPGRRHRARRRGCRRGGRRRRRQGSRGRRGPGRWSGLRRGGGQRASRRRIRWRRY